MTGLTMDATGNVVKTNSPTKCLGHGAGTTFSIGLSLAANQITFKQ